MGLGGALGGLGQYDAALTAKLKAVELDPRSAGNYGDVGDGLMFARGYAEADEYFSKASELLPDWTVYYERRALNYLLWDGNTERAEAVLETWPGGAPPSSRAWIEALKRNWQGALEHTSHREDDDLGKHTNRCYYHWKAGQSGPARDTCEKARLLLEQAIEDRPESADSRATLGIVYARLGRKADAIREGRRAVELEPLSDHALINTRFLIDLAEIYATAGEQDAAIEELDHLLSIPSWISVPMLRMDPVWDPLRDNPKFSELLDKYET